MSERIEPETDVRDALGVATKILIAQAFALDRLFFRAAMESAVSGRPHYHARKALKAQARCRATFKVLLALRAAAGDREKFYLEWTRYRRIATSCRGRLAGHCSGFPPWPPWFRLTPQCQ
jgi:hypothetical protein